MSVFLSDFFSESCKKAAISLLSSKEEIIQLPEAEDFCIARTKHLDMLCIGKMTIDGVDLFILQKK